METTQTSTGMAEAARLLSSLGAAWTTYRLYPNPTEQPAFVMAVKSLGTFEGSSLGFEVGAGWFALDGEPIDAKRDGVDRLATRLYIHDVEHLRIARPPTAADLAELFRLADADEHEIADRGGIDVALADAEITSLSIVRRGLLGKRGDPHENGDGTGSGANDGLDESSLSGVAKIVVEGAPAEEVAARFLDEAGGEPHLAADRFVEAFQEIHGPDRGSPAELGINDALAPYWSDGVPAPPIVTFAGAFSHLPEASQAPILKRFLARTDDVAHRLFLDQLSGEQIIRLAPHLEGAEAEALLAYVRDCLDRADGTLEDLLPLLTSGSVVRDERGNAAGRIGELVRNPDGVLAVSGETFDALHVNLVDSAYEAIGRQVIRGLLSCEKRDHRFRRLVRIWTGKVSAHIRAGRFGAAAALLASVRDDPPYPPDRRGEVDEALGKLLTPELLTDLIERYAGGGEDSEALELLSRLGPGAAAKLVDALASEESPALRRTLIDMVGAVGHSYPRALAAGLQDERWFVVRNLATALGKTGRREAAEALRKVRSHGDHRVRGEVLRSLVRLLRDEDGAATEIVAALGDPNERVRETAMGYLRTGEFEGVDAALADALARDAVDGEVLGPVVELLGRLRSPAAVSALETIAGKRVGLSSGARAVRQQARDALRKVQG